MKIAIPFLQDKKLGGDPGIVIFDINLNPISKTEAKNFCENSQKGWCIEELRDMPTHNSILLVDGKKIKRGCYYIVSTYLDDEDEITGKVFKLHELVISCNHYTLGVSRDKVLTKVLLDKMVSYHNQNVDLQ